MARHSLTTASCHYHSPALAKTSPYGNVVAGVTPQEQKRALVAKKKKRFFCLIILIEKKIRVSEWGEEWFNTAIHEYIVWGHMGSIEREKK